MDIIFKKTVGFYAGIHTWFSERDIQPLHMFYLLFWLTLAPLFLLHFEGAKMVGVVLIILSPFWLTTALVIAIWRLWMDYINLRFLADPKQEPILMEIIIPKSVHKSPLAMELFFNGLLLSQGTTTGFDVYWHGRVRPWWSVEIVGKNGEVKMYMWCWRRFKDHVEAQLYGQFPEAELKEVEDYVTQIEYDPKQHFAWGHRYKLSKGEAYPIKTYFDYGLHDNADKWETKVDPMVNILEKFALMKEGEQLWMQILFQKSDRDVTKEAEVLIEEIHDNRATEYPSMADPEEMVKGFPMLLPSDREKVDAIQRASKKPAFDVIIRNLYIADFEHMNTLRIQSMGKMFNYYDGHNSLIAFEGRAKGGDYPWEKFTLPDQSKILRTFINAYRVRGGFYAPYKRPSVTLSTEELATIFHFPSEESQVPGMQKAQARSVPPPTNLPV